MSSSSFFRLVTLLIGLSASAATTVHAAALPRASASAGAVTQLPDYVLQFAPFSYLFSNESWFPADVATHLKHVTPEDGTDPVASSVSFSTIGGLASDIYLTANDNPFSSPQASWFTGVKPDATGFTSSPATIIAVEKPGNIVDAFYFTFFSYDHSTYLDITIGDHVGDWEHHMVRFVNGAPQTLYLSAHSGGSAYTFSAMPKQNGRPIVYIATGTHANYAKPGDHQHDVPGLLDHTDAGTPWDMTKNFRGFWFDNSTQTFTPAGGVGQGATEEASGEGAGWLQFEGKWGDKQYALLHRGQYCIGIPDLVTECKLEDGPTGPIAKNLGRNAVCQNEDDCTINTSV